MLERKAKDDIMLLRQQGRPLPDIEKMFASDPHINIKNIIKQVRAFEIAQEKNDQALV